LGFLAADVARARAGSEALFTLEPSRAAPLRIGLALDYMKAAIEDEAREAVRRAVVRLRARGVEPVETALPECAGESVARANLIQVAEGWMSLGAWIGAAGLPPLLAE